MLKKLIAAAALFAASGGCIASTVGQSTVPHKLGKYVGGATAPAIAVSSRGDVIVVWEDFGEDYTQDVYFSHQVIGTWNDSPATRLRHVETAGNSFAPVVAMSATGDFVIVWQGDAGIHAQRFSPDGIALGGEFQVNETDGSDAKPAVAMDAFGDFIVVWQRSDDSSGSIIGRRFLNDGSAASGDFRIDDATTAANANPSLAMGARGEFVVAWEAGADVRLKSFAADGAPDGPDAPAAGLVAQSRRGPSVGMDAFGRFVVAWNNTDLAGNSSIQARQYLAGGSAAGTEFVVNQTRPSETEGELALGVGATGAFAVIWEGTYESQSPQLFKQQFAADGTRLAEEDRAEYTYSRMPAVAVDADGDAYAAYFSYDYESVIAMRRYTGPEEIDLSVRVSDSPDPAPMGSTVQYSVTLTNHHPVSTDTGIPEVDAGIGFSEFQAVALELSGMSFTNVETPCFRLSSVRVTCQPTGIAVGNSITQLLLAANPSQSTVVSISAQIFAETHVDPNTSNSTATETTNVCNGGPGTFVIRQAPASVEEGEAATVAIERVNGTCGNVSLLFETSAPADVIVGSGSLTWANGESGLRYAVVQTVEDAIHEDPQSFDITFLSPSGGATLAQPSRVTIDILDDDPIPTLSFVQAGQVTREGAGVQVTLAAELSGPSSREVKVLLSSSGSAARGTDWSMNGDWLVFPAGSRTATKTVQILNNGVIELDEQVTFSMGSPANAVLGGTTAHTVTIKDNDPEALGVRETVQGAGGP